MSFLENKTVQFTTLSPIMIRGTDRAYGQGFVRRDEMTKYAIDAKKFMEFLVENKGDIAEKYIEEISSYIDQNKFKKFNFEAFLQENGIYHFQTNKTYLPELIRMGVFKSVVNAPKSDRFIRNAMGQPYIPGSALKGMIRTAIAWHIARQKLHASSSDRIQNIIKNIPKRLEEAKKNPKEREYSAKAFGTDLMNAIFQNNDRMNANRDVLRSIKIKDSDTISTRDSSFIIASLKPIDNARISLVGKLRREGPAFVDVGGCKYYFSYSTIVTEQSEINNNIGNWVKIHKLDKKNEIFEFEVLDERPKEENVQIDGYKIDKKDDGLWPIDVFEGTFQIELTIDHRVFETPGMPTKPFNSIIELLNIVSEYYHAVYEFETSYFTKYKPGTLDVSNVRQFYDSDRANMPLCRVGGGSGWHSLTIGMLLEEKHRGLARQIIDHFHDSDKARPGFPAPKSRKLVWENNTATNPFGWMTFKIL